MNFLCLLVLCFALDRCWARNCPDNIVGIATRRQAPLCGTNFGALTTADFSGRNALSTVVQRGRSAGLQRGQQELPREKRIVDSGITVQHNTPEYHHYLLTTPIPDQARYFNKSTRDLYLAQEISKAVVQEYNLPEYLGGDVLTVLQIPAERDSCNAAPRCNSSSPYRTYDGSCNNINNPTWGMAGVPYTRVLASLFDDGIFKPRTSVIDNSVLVSERLARTTLIKDANVPDQINANVLMNWAQVVAHDILNSADDVCYGGVGCMCCTQNGKFLSDNLLSRNCYPIRIPQDDYVFGRYNRSCMSVQRQNKTFALNCKLSGAEDINSQSSYIDLSLVYGPGEDLARQLREMRDGKLRVSQSGGRPMLPRSTDPYQDCDVPATGTCYAAGDGRVNQNPQLSVLQTVLMRAHNDIASRMKSKYPTRNDESLFQETRRILIAMTQHITYQEMLPIYLGEQMALKHDLPPLNSGYNNGYNPNLNAMIINSFAGGCYRLPHGIIQPNISFVDESRRSVRSVTLSDHFTNPRIIDQPSSNFDDIIRGITSQPPQLVDEFMTEQITNFMFKRNANWGQDLGALDIARGRERGVPSYNHFRELCGLSRASTINEFLPQMNSKRVADISKLYKHPDDVDLYVGCFYENLVYDSMFGPTCHCIILEQFYRLKFGDRYFYEFPTSGFSLAQLNSIRKVTLSHLLCKYGDNVTSMQQWSFRKISSQNPLKSCKDIPGLDLTPW